MNSKNDEQLERAVDEAVEASSHGFKRDEVLQIVNSVIERMQTVTGMSVETMYKEINSLSDFIQEARSDLSQLSTDDIQKDFIPTATDELDAIVEATEQATGRIMDNCDKVQEVASSLEGEPQDTLVAAVTDIFEACAFQDITGQRISKVVSTLKKIEERVENFAQVLGEATGIENPRDTQENMTDEPAELSDEDLMNGPQLPGQSISQDEIDKLLAEFD